MNTYTIDTESLDFEKGLHDGYNGLGSSDSGSLDYEAGWLAGESQWESDAYYAHEYDHFGD
jgi:hypothetical protein